MESGFFNPFPKYLQIRHILRRRFGRDFWPGDRLPTELELVEQFGVSRETVREALRGLEDDGLIRRRRGSGTVVVKVPDPGPDERLTGLVDDFTELKLDTEAEVLSKGVEHPPAEIMAALNGTDDPMYRICRRRLLDRIPLVYHDCYLPLEIGAAVTRLDLRKTTVLHEVAATLGHAIHEDIQRIDATVADAEMAGLLKVPVGAPLLVIVRVFGVGSFGPAMFFRSYFRSDRYYYTVQLAPVRHPRKPPVSGQREDQHANQGNAATNG